MIQVRLKRERREALSSPSMRQIKEGGQGPAKPVITHMGKSLQDAGPAEAPPAS
jgi:NosR/NirI family nitrous oxide reductase transcriptional regulator